MGVVKQLSNYRPQLEVVEHRVAQLEDGYLRLANELLDATMCSGLPETELCILMAVWRKTYGYGKKIDWISNEQLEGMIDKHFTHCSTAKNNLVRRKVLVQEGRKIGMNTNISEWQTKNNGYCKTLAKPAKKTLAEPANRPLQNLLTTKDNITKENKYIKNTMSDLHRTSCEKASEEPAKRNPIDDAFESIFWGAGMRKAAKAKAKTAFRTKYLLWRKTARGTPEDFARMLAEDIQARLASKQFGFDKLLPTSYLNGERWEDEKSSSPAATQTTAAVFYGQNSFHADFSKL
ncbi:replication protein [Serratia marcescens]|nr:replication protein [Serratia marcescens]MBN5194659.1 replication protein [Serratia marcescens]